MKTASLNQGIAYNEAKPKIEVLLETTFSKEIRILFKKGQLMKSHKAPLPIVVEVFQGEILFGVENEKMNMKAGDLIALESNIVHDLKANSDSIVRLTLSKGDSPKRVKTVND